MIRIENRGKKAEIVIYEDIGDVWGGATAKTFADDLKKLGDVGEINVRINSGGGNVFDGIAIYNSLKRHPARVVVDVDGLAASIASVVAMAGDEIRMADNALMMIHDPWIMTAGSAADLRNTAETLDKVREVLLDTYEGRTRRDREEISGMMAAETWMTSAEAVEAGFADAATEELAIAAHVDIKRFKNAPQSLAQLVKPAKPENGARKLMNAKLAQTLRHHNILR